MTATPLGDILPTKKSLAINDRVYRNTYQMQAREATSQGLTQYERREVGGEVRFYKTKTVFAIVARSGKVLWFEVRGNETYSITTP